MYEKEKKVLKKAEKIAKKVVDKYYLKKYEATKKQDGSNVTQADKELETLLREAILQEFPKDKIVGEEHENINEKSMREWIIDPIDGTDDFIEKNGQFCTCIAFMDKGELKVSSVIAPALKKVYTAERGKGSYLNGKKLKVSTKDNLKDSRVVVSIHISNTKKEAYKEFKEIQKYGSTALRMCIVAEGKTETYFFDNLINPRLSIWDMAASQLILEEAGGKVTDIFGKKISLKKEKLKTGLIASNGKIHDEVVRILRR